MDNNCSPTPLYPETLDAITEDQLTYAFQAQETATTCISAMRYYSDSMVDPVNSAAEALAHLNGFYYDSDVEGFKAWVADEENGPRNYCSEGLSSYLYSLIERLFPEED